MKLMKGPLQEIKATILPINLFSHPISQTWWIGKLDELVVCEWWVYWVL